MRSALLIASLAAVLTACASQTPAPFNLEAGPDQTAPQVFFPETVSRTASPQWDIAFSADGRTLYYSTDAPRRIMAQHWDGKAWSAPEKAIASMEMAHGGVSISPDGNFLYFSAAPDGEARDLYRLDLTEQDTPPQRLTSTPLYGEISVSFDKAGNGAMWTDTKQDGTDGIGFYRVLLEGNQVDIIADWSNLQTGDTSGENGPYMDPEGRFILFSNYDISPNTEEDMFLSELRDGAPLPPVSLGDTVNTPASEGNPTLSPDGKHLIFVSNRNDEGDGSSGSQLYSLPVSAIPALNAVLTASVPSNGLNISPMQGQTVTSDQITTRDGLDYIGDSLTPFTGIVEDRHPNGAKKRRKHIEGGRTQGVWVEWYDTGVPSFYSEWNKGLGEGTWLYFHENGEIRQRAYTEADIWVGMNEGWSETGEKNYQSVLRNGVRTSLWRATPPTDE